MTTPLYVFVEGEPHEPCRPYTDAEWSLLVNSVIPSSVLSSSSISSPVAIFVSGLPGCGKSSSFHSIHSALSQSSSSPPPSRFIPPLEDISIIDFDKLRNFHEQYKQFSNKPIPSSQFQSYKELVPWFLSGTDFERTFFRETSSNRGLLPHLLSLHVSFAMEAVLDSKGCFDFVQYVHGCGYKIIFVHVHVPVEKAVARAQTRAYRTGRWSGSSFIKSREEGLYKWFVPIAHFVLHETVDGTVAFYDNSVDNSPPSLIFCAPHLTSDWNTSQQHPELWQKYKLQELMSSSPLSNIVFISKKQLQALVISHATQLITCYLIPSSSSISITREQEWSVSFCLAGGCFKSLITGNPPRDLDLWPSSEEDHKKLLQLLQNNQNALFKNHSLYNTQFQVSNGETVMEVEVVNKWLPPTLKEKVERFDIALSAIGVQFTLIFNPNCSSSLSSSPASSFPSPSHWEIVSTDVYIHSNWIISLDLQQPLLIFPMPNPSFILATAERVIRYAIEFGWNLPSPQIEFLQKQFSNTTVEEKERLVDNYRTTTRGSSAQLSVCKVFNVQI